MSTNSYQLLLTALNMRTSCYALYDNHPRYFCPHVIGYKDGVEQVLCWQYAGTSSKPLPAEGMWKCLTISKMVGLTTTDQAWHPGQPGKTGVPTPCVDQVEAIINL